VLLPRGLQLSQVSVLHPQPLVLVTQLLKFAQLIGHGVDPHPGLHQVRGGQVDLLSERECAFPGQESLRQVAFELGRVRPKPCSNEATARARCFADSELRPPIQLLPRSRN
jgi:hypothetical protein